MIGVVCISKQDKLIGKRKHTCLLVQKKTEQKRGGLKWLGQKRQLVAGKKRLMLKDRFMKLFGKIPPVISPKPISPNYRLLSAESFCYFALFKRRLDSLNDSQYLWFASLLIIRNLIKVCDAINN